MNLNFKLIQQQKQFHFQQVCKHHTLNSAYSVYMYMYTKHVCIHMYCMYLMYIHNMSHISFSDFVSCLLHFT